jgi:SagB-type dehydrogenase family enzyme
MRLTALFAIAVFLACGCGAQPVEKNVIELPKPVLKGKMSLEETLAARRSVRSFTEDPLTLQQVAQILWAGQGVTKRGALNFRTAPSAGALYPMELYLVVGDKMVKGLAAGVYHYDPDTHTMTRTLDGDLRKALSDAALGQTPIEKCACDLVITAVYARTAKKYGERATRYVHIEAGHVGENVALQCVALKLGCVTIGAFYDDKVKEALKLPGDHEPLYIIPIAHPAASE